MFDAVFEVRIGEFDAFGLIEVCRNFFHRGHGHPEDDVDLFGAESRRTRAAVDVNDFNIFAGTLCNFREQSRVEASRFSVRADIIEGRQVARNTDFNCVRAVSHGDFNCGGDLTFVDVDDVFCGEFFQRAVSFHFVEDFIKVSFERGIFLAHGEAEIVAESFEREFRDVFILVVVGDEIFGDTLVKADLVDAALFDTHLHEVEAVVIGRHVMSDFDARIFLHHFQNFIHALFGGV